MIYEYRCKSCKAEKVLALSVRDHVNKTPCDCGETMSQIITAPRVIEDIQPYRSMITGERIRGRSHHRDHLRKHNVIEVGNERVERKETPMPSVVPDIKRAIQELS